jgi:hypothetical protein
MKRVAVKSPVNRGKGSTKPIKRKVLEVVTSKRKHWKMLTLRKAEEALLMRER